MAVDTGCLSRHMLCKKCCVQKIGRLELIWCKKCATEKENIQDG